MADFASNRPGYGQPDQPEISSAGTQPAHPETSGNQQVDNDLPTTVSPLPPSLDVSTSQEMGHNQPEEEGAALLSATTRDERRAALLRDFGQRHLSRPPPLRTTEPQGHRPIPLFGFEEEIKRYEEQREKQRAAARPHHFSRILPTPSPGQNPLDSGREITLGLIDDEIGDKPTPRTVLQLVPTLVLKLRQGQLECPLLNGRKLEFDTVLTKRQAVEFGRFICCTRPEMFAPEVVVFDICPVCDKSKVRRAPLSLIDTSSRPDVRRPASWSQPVPGTKKQRPSEASAEIWDHPKSPPKLTPEALPDTPPGPPQSPPVLEGPRSWVECKFTSFGTQGFSEFAQSPCCVKSICNDCYQSRDQSRR
ncbi:hypothetical protein GE09DRAFT_1218936 [Coniochaeta sp. 2T2.1]|nr:hypothetical protein GE09DRAFT_1218936 [Coniochaeta sp. 2T2.1]